jgi:Ni,Fe-hydrogenase III large subunit
VSLLELITGRPSLRRRVQHLEAEVQRLEMLLMQEPAFRDRVKFNGMLEHVINVARAEGQL